jgi:hypothetical protein
MSANSIVVLSKLCPLLTKFDFVRKLRQQFTKFDFCKQIKLVIQQIWSTHRNRDIASAATGAGDQTRYENHVGTVCQQTY